MIKTCRYLIVVTAAMAAGCANLGQAGNEEHEDDEQAVTVDQLPPAVKATLQREAGSGRIDGIVKEVEDGKTLYEADVTADGKQWEIFIGEDGTLIKKQLEQEKDEEHEHKR